LDYQRKFFELAEKVLTIAEKENNIPLAHQVCKFIENLEDEKGAIRFARILAEKFTMPIIKGLALQFLEKKALEGVKVLDKTNTRRIIDKILTETKTKGSREGNKLAFSRIRKKGREL
jgi:hypothetical protein